MVETGLEPDRHGTFSTENSTSGMAAQYIAHHIKAHIAMINKPLEFSK